MVEMNGREFKDWAEASAYAEKQARLEAEAKAKEAEEKAKADAEEKLKAKKGKAFELISNLGCVCKVTMVDTDKTYLVCTLGADADKKSDYCMAYIEAVFGRKYKTSENDVVQRYTISRVANPSIPMKDYLAGMLVGRHKDDARQVVVKRNAEVCGVPYTEVVLKSFLDASSLADFCEGGCNFEAEDDFISFMKTLFELLG